MKLSVPQNPIKSIIQKVMITPSQDGGVEECTLIFSCENSKTTTSCWTVIDRRMLEPSEKDISHPRGKEKPIPMGEKMQKGKTVIWGGFTNSWEKQRSESQKRKANIHPFECRVPKDSKER